MIWPFDCDLQLVHAPSVYDFRRETILYGPVSDVVPSRPVFEMYPVGFTSIAEYLDAKGYRTRLLNLAYRMLADDSYDAVKVLKRRRPRVAFGIDLHWLPHAHGAIEVARLIKGLHPDLPIIMGGIASTYFHEELIGYDCVDYVLRGDSTERPFGLLMDYLARGEGSLEAIPNLTWQDEKGQTRSNELTHIEPDLDSFTNNYLRMFKAGIRHADIRNMIPFTDWWTYPITAVMTCRGCTQNCVICGGCRQSYGSYLKRPAVSFRSPRKLVQDVLRIARYTHGPIFFIGDLRQGGPAYAREVLELLKPHQIPNYMILELFFGADEAWMDLIAETFPNFNFEMSPETHDDQIRAFGGKPYTNRDVLKSVELAFERGVKKFDLYFMTGLPGQTEQSVMETIDWTEELMQRFDLRLALFVSPLAPFLDPGSTAYENAEKYGVRILYKGLENHRRALLEPSWKYTLNYETDCLTRQQIVDVTYEAGRRLNRLKGKYGFLDRELVEQTDRRIAQAIEIDKRIDRIIEETPPGPERQERLRKLKPVVDQVSASTVCDTEEIKWPTLMARNFQFLHLARDILLGPKF